MCLIHTATPSHRTRAKTVFETWARRCDDFLFFTDSQMDSTVPHVFWPLLHTRDHSWEKIRRVFKHVVDNVEKSYDWYLRADDDAFVVVDNLRTFVSKFAPTTPHLLGYRWNFFMPYGFIDGSAYILSRPALEAFNVAMRDPLRCPEHHRAEEDQEIAKCLAAVGVLPENSRDGNGSDRFHHFHPLEQFSMFEDAFARRCAYYPPLEGEENFSPEIVSFHHVSPYEMRLLDFILHRVESL